MLDIVLIVISALCLIAGLAGCILPFLPGPPIAYLGLVFLHLTDKVQYSTTQLIVWLLIIAVLQVLDYFTQCWEVNIAAVVNGEIGDASSERWSGFFSCLGELLFVAVFLLCFLFFNSRKVWTYPMKYVVVSVCFFHLYCLVLLFLCSFFSFIILL